MENSKFTFHHMYASIQDTLSPTDGKCFKCQKQYTLKITPNSISYLCQKKYTVNINPDLVILQECSQCKKSICFECYKDSYWIQESEYFNVTIHNQTGLINPYKEGFNDIDKIYFACSPNCYETISNILA